MMCEIHFVDFSVIVLFGEVRLGVCLNHFEFSVGIYEQQKIV